jgi:hypothetical protein
MMWVFCAGAAVVAAFAWGAWIWDGVKKREPLAVVAMVLTAVLIVLWAGIFGICAG